MFLRSSSRWSLSYEDKYGFETDLTSCSVFSESLGVSFYLEHLVLEIKEQRKQEPLQTIVVDVVLGSRTLDPGGAGKLGGKHCAEPASSIWQDFASAQKCSGVVIFSCLTEER
ncbi:URC1, partial [Symbiodinium sp. CCMP2456]